MLADIFGPDGLIVLIVVAAVILFGGSALPKLARGLGSAQHEFRRGLTEGEPDGEPTATPGGTDHKTEGAEKS